MLKMTPDSRMCKQLGTLAAAAIFCCATALAQTAGSGSMQPASPSSTPNSMQPNSAGSMNQMQSANGMSGTSGGTAMADKKFLKKSMQDSMAEVQTAQLALQKSSNDQVKQFAQKMIDDHNKLIEQAKPVAQQLGVTPPTEPSKKDQAEMAKLQGLSGDAFDKAYMKHMVKDHKMDSMEFKTEANSGQNPQVKELASQGSPIIDAHLQMAEQISQSTTK